MPAPEFCPRCSAPVPLLGFRGALVAQKLMPFPGMMRAARLLTASCCAVSSSPLPGQSSQPPGRLCPCSPPPCPCSTRCSSRDLTTSFCRLRWLSCLTRLLEIMAADRAVWQSVHALMQGQIMVAVRQLERDCLLPPRHVFCPPSHVSAASPGRPGGSYCGSSALSSTRAEAQASRWRNGPKPKTTPAASASAEQVPAAKAFDKSWFKKVNSVETCMRGALLPPLLRRLSLYRPSQGPVPHLQLPFTAGVASAQPVLVPARSMMSCLLSPVLACLGLRLLLAAHCQDPCR